MDEIKIENIARVCFEAIAAYLTTTGAGTQKTWKLANSLEKDAFILRVREVIEHPESPRMDTVENNLIVSIINVLK